MNKISPNAGNLVLNNNTLIIGRLRTERRIKRAFSRDDRIWSSPVAVRVTTSVSLSHKGIETKSDE